MIRQDFSPLYTENSVILAIDLSSKAFIKLLIKPLAKVLFYIFRLHPMGFKIINRTFATRFIQIKECLI